MSCLPRQVIMITPHNNLFIVTYIIINIFNNNSICILYIKRIKKSYTDVIISNIILLIKKCDQCDTSHF